MTAKTPFEKVRSLVERKKLFEDLLLEKGEMVCKGEDDSLFYFRPSAIVKDQHIQGWIRAIDQAPKSDTNVLGNFSIGADRFFFQAAMNISGEEGVFETTCDVFKLQRRATVRLHVQASFGLYMAITELNGKSVYSVAQIADVSAGGARIFFSTVESPIPALGNTSNPGIQMGSRFKAVLNFGNRKTVDVICEVKHSQQAVHRGVIVEHFGIEFVDFTPGLKNRLLGLTMDLQRRMVYEDF
ncbi:MAG: PilZ domain-containing protein [Pseudobdellovibrionaceae bacterium]